MGVVYSPESDYMRELAKWEKPYRYERFPQMLYKAHPNASGQPAVGDAAVAVGEPAAIAFTNRCQRTVRSESEYERAISDGWRDTPALAMEQYERLQQAIAQAAAERAYQDQRMTEKARAEAAAADAATHEHVADVPAPRKVGRPARVTEA